MFTGRLHVILLVFIDNDFKGILERLKGRPEGKWYHMGDVNYNYGKERYIVCQKARKEKQGQAKSRRQVEIERLIR